MRPIIHARFQGKRLVAVGSELHWDDAEGLKSFPDFLFTYIWNVLGAEWGRAEIAKPREARHPIVLWKEGLYSYTRALPRDADGTYRAEPDAPTRAYLLLAYDLYVVRDNVELQRRFVNRLKIRDQFQGARYELSATATFIRAGFKIDFEREKNPTGTHNEFIATHRSTGQRFVLEAKSKHRRGVLGFTGGFEQDPATAEVGVRGLLEAALAKPAPHPRAVFIDVNLPPERLQGIDLDPALAEMNDAVVRFQREDGLSPWNLIVFTNYPYPYVEPGRPFPRKSEFAWRLIANRPAHAIEHPAAFAALDAALAQYGNVPNEFPGDAD